LLEIFCVYTEISVTNIGVLAAFPASFCLLFFAGQRHIFKVQAAYNTLEASQTTLFGLGDISPLFSFISYKFLKFF
jgi:hypothetical protein